MHVIECTRVTSNTIRLNLWKWMIQITFEGVFLHVFDVIGTYLQIISVIQLLQSMYSF